MEQLAVEGNLIAYRHEDFWQCMDTLRDLRLLEGLWAGGRAPWKVWEK
jgi:glucose-1-phosphate cytidylyltransferase